MYCGVTRNQKVDFTLNIILVSLSFNVFGAGINKRLLTFQTFFIGNDSALFFILDVAMLPHLHLTLDDIDRVQCNLIVSNLRAIVVFVLLEGFFDEALEMQLDDVQLSVHLPFIRKRCRVVHL